MDAFYAACERVRLGLDPGHPLLIRLHIGGSDFEWFPDIPLVVQQWESLVLSLPLSE